MVLVSGSRLREVYDQLVSDWHVSGQRVHMLVNPNVDGLCGVNILRALLQADAVQYAVHTCQSVSGMLGLMERLGSAGEDDEGASIVLINCGAGVKLRHPCYVLDSFRPINLRNVYSEDVVCVLGEMDEEQVEDWMENGVGDGDYLTDGGDSDDDDTDQEDTDSEEEEEDQDLGEQEVRSR